MVIAEDGEQLGLMTKFEALDAAYDRDLDLVVVAPGAKPPVAKFMDHKKYKFEQQKKKREAKKNQKVQDMKEIRLSPVIDIGDFNTKLKQGRKFLEKGDKLKISIRFKGRQMAYTNNGREVILRFADECSDLAELSNKPKLDGRNMMAILTPLKDKKK